MIERRELYIFLLFFLGLLQFRPTTSLRRRHDVSPPPRLVRVPLPTTPKATDVNVTVLDNLQIDNQNVRGYLVTSNNPFSWSCVVPHTCNAVKKTSVQARRNSCHVATNGGPFQSYIHGGCFGGVVSNDNVVSSQFSSSLIGFGRSSQEWIFGGVANNTEATQVLGLQEFVTGFGWLVYNGKAVPIKDNDTGAEKAARTAIGLGEKGQVMILVVDGCERCLVTKHRGLTLSQLAALFVSLGAQHAINLDGGGSSTFVQDGKVLNFPTCMDLVRFKCERPVTTVMCVSNNKTR